MLRSLTIIRALANPDKSRPAISTVASVEALSISTISQSGIVCASASTDFKQRSIVLAALKQGMQNEIAGGE
jgi:hypothetical protein